MLTQQQSLARGTRNHVFTENSNKYCCVGAQLGRAERGVLSGLYELKNGFPSKEWDSLHKLLKHGEYAFNRYMDTDVIRHIYVHGQEYTSRQWSHHHPHLVRRMQYIIMDLDLA